MKKIFVLGLVLAQTMLAADNDGVSQTCVKNMSDRAKLHAAQGGKEGVVAKAKRGFAQLGSGLAQQESQCFNLEKGKKSIKVSVWYEQADGKDPIKKIYSLKAGTYKFALKETNAGFIPVIYGFYPESEIGLAESDENKQKNTNQKKMKKETKKMNKKSAGQEAAADQSNQY